MKPGKKILAFCLSALLAMQMGPQPALAFTTAMNGSGSQSERVSSYADASSMLVESGQSDSPSIADGIESNDASNGQISNDVDASVEEPADENADAESSVVDSTGGDSASVGLQPAEQAADNTTAVQSSTYEIDTLADLKSALNKASDKIEDDGSSITKLKEATPANLVILSHSNPSLYKSAAIEFSSTGDFDLTAANAKADYKGSQLTFQGLGSESVPFCGTLGGMSFILDRALFAGYRADSSGKSFSLKFTGRTQGDNLFADYVVGENGRLSVSASFSGQQTVITAPLLGQVGGSLSLDVSYGFIGGTGSSDSYSKDTEIDVNGKAGLIVRSVAENGSLELSSLTGFRPNSIKVNSKDANSGLFVGEIGKAGSFKMCGLGSKAGTGGFSKFSPSGTISAPQGAAGGLVGSVAENAKVGISEGEVDLSGLSIEGTTSGGFIGLATKVVLDDGSFTGKLTLPKKVGTTNINGTQTATTVAGGFMGNASFAAEFTFPNADKVAFPVEGIGLSGNGTGKGQAAGAIFGVLGLYSKVTITGRNDISSKVQEGKINYGGIAGYVFLGDTSVASNLSVLSSTVATAGGSDKTYYYGGLVGWLGSGDKSSKTKAALIVRGANVTSDKPEADRGFGGAVGIIDTATVDLGSFGLNTNGSPIKFVQAKDGHLGGVVAEMWEGSVLRLSGTTDLSAAKFEDGDKAGQLVGLRTGSLVYADGTGSNADASDPGLGWSYKRPQAVTLDDIGTSGEVARLAGDLAGLVSLDEKNNAVIDGASSITEPSYTISNRKDYARLALAWQSGGKFAAISNAIDVIVDGEIDLSGTGLGGLTVDAKGDGYSTTTPTYSGSLTGQNNAKVILAIGEPYGMRGDSPIESSDSSEGNGKIYRHDRLGLFASMSGNVSDLAISGSIKFAAKKDVNAGSLAANLSNANSSFSGLTVSTSINCDIDNGIKVNLGGLLGCIDGDSGAISFEAGNSVDSQIAIASNAQRVVGGGVVGSIEATCSASIKVKSGGLKLSGLLSASSNTSGDHVPVGGFIGVIQPLAGTEQKRSVELSGLAIEDFSLQYNKSASAVGGLLGFLWADADISFGEGGLVTSKASVAASGNASVASLGGLAYCASGKWAIGSNGIDLSGCTLDGVTDKLGLLVCQGGPSEFNIAGGDKKTTKGLYLEVAAGWDSACKLNPSICGTRVKAQQFDEWIASTVDTCTGEGHENNILAAGLNGLVSLRTDTGRVAMDGDACNTYVNRTNYGKSYKTNVNTRYYYNLDFIRDEIKASGADGKIDTPQELMLWSAIKYVPSDLAGYLAVPGTDCSGGVNGISGNLDMLGYSYYPVDINRASISISGASIAFHNREIEESEGKAANKKTSEQSQHMSMHAGLFRNYSNKGNDSIDQTLLKVGDGGKVSFAGTVGMMASGNNGSYTPLAYSGALICGEASGSLSSAGSKSMVDIQISECELGGLTVYDFVNRKRDYAPALINLADSYVNLAVNNVYASGYKTGEKAGTSLIGDFGKTNGDTSNSTQLTISFSQIELPASPNSALFTKASLLNSFAYASGTGIASASYNFIREDSRKTFGQEIDRLNTEYSGKQLWFYNEDTYKQEAGYATDGEVTASPVNEAFKPYLPYVYKTSKTNSGASVNHEIKVNQRFENLVDGCGSYGDPYVISSESKLQALADYISDPKNANDGWQITIAAEQNVICKGDEANETKYTYSASGSWLSEDGRQLSNDVMHRYIQSCYIDLEPEDPSKDNTLTLGSGFNGLGNSNNPFRGVLVSKNGTTVKLQRDGSAFNGLVQYSYGSVIKNLNIEYTGLVALTDASIDDAHKAPNSFFGGVIGNILGGDNIIEDVTVKMESLFSAVPSQLIPVGGYVGVICGGGVVFRGVEGNGYGGNSSYLYNNPVVGRVLDGYAFSEGAQGLGDNTVNGKACNYKVNDLGDNSSEASDKVITTDSIEAVDSGIGNATHTTVQDAKGLLILSAIINSGAAAGATNSNSHYRANGSDDRGSVAGTNAYYGLKGESSDSYSFGNANYGKVRNASYKYVGKPNEIGASEDFNKSVNDDALTPGSADGTLAKDIVDYSKVNSPYLVSRYASDAKTMFICGAGVNAFSLSFGDGDFDLSDYGTGYLGLSGRYISNAALNSSDSDDAWAKDRITPRIAKIDGNDKSLKVNLYVNEYKKDNFFTLGVGALGSYLLFTQNNIGNTLGANGYYIENLNIVDSAVEHKRIEGGSSDKEAPDWTGVGAVAGVAAGDATLNEKPIRLKNVVVGGANDADAVTVLGFATAGGFFGNSSLYGYASGKAGATGIVKSNDMLRTTSKTKKIALQFHDCGFTKTKVTGGDYAGGFVGCVNRDLGSGNFDTSSLGFDNEVKSSGSVIRDTGKDSSISTTSFTETSGYLDAFLGGMFGYLNQKTNVEGGDEFPVKLVDVSASTENFVYATGGIVGKLDYYAAGSTFSHVEITSDKQEAEAYPKIGSTKASQNNGGSWNKGDDKAGGFIGSVELSANGKVLINDCLVSKIHVITREADGGFIGFAKAGTIKAKNIEVSDSSIDGSYSGGFLGGIYNRIANGDVNVEIENAKFARNNIGKKGNSAQWSTQKDLGSLSGGIMGDARGRFAMSNVMLDSCNFLGKLDGSFRQGLVCGAADSGRLDFVRIAGLEVRLPDGTKLSDYPDKLVLAGEDISKADAALDKTFISFSNYNEEAKVSEGKGLVGGVEQNAPYVATSPVSNVAVRESGSEDDGYLFGDGANVEVARNIVDEKDRTDINRFTYKNIAGQKNGEYSSDNSFNPESSIATYRDNNADSKVAGDFNVLQVSGSNAAQTVEDYLNVVTNGGFADAKAKNGSGAVYVAADAAVYKENDDGVFEKQDASVQPNVTVRNSGSNSMGFDVSSGYDNGDKKFTLLTVTFSAAGNADVVEPSLTHTVVVPVLVRRQLETTFTATLDHGTPFNEANYANRGAGVRLLESYGNSSTALLTFQYNKALSEKTEYGWDSYLAAGGSMGAAEKQINFVSNGGANLPAGTRFTLVDKDNGDHTYTYTLDQPASSVDLSQFADTESNGKYSPKWMSELMGATAVKTEGKSGAWVKLESSDGATVKAKSQTDDSWGFYRPAQSGDTGDRFNIFCEKDEHGSELTSSESFYLVIYIPQSESADALAINGSVQARVECEGVKIGDIKYALRTDGSEDNHLDTASTYNFVSTYAQTLSDESSDKPGPKVPEDPEQGAGKVLHMRVVDKIDRGADQLYTEKDPLHYRLEASLTSYENSASTGSSGFPEGTSGTANFYVFTGDGDSKTYYKFRNGKWISVGSDRSIAESVVWKSDGSVMGLELGDDLATIRSQGVFCVETEMDIHLSEDAYKVAIAPSQEEGRDAYTILNYRACLSDSEAGLKSSSAVASKTGEAKYYREDTGVATISLAANQTKQLGINLNDLNSAGDGNIGATGVYDLTGLTNADDVIAKADKVVYTLTLEKRSDTDGRYTPVDSDIKSYFTVSSDELDTPTYDGKSYVWEDAEKKTKDSASNKFKLSLRIKVNTTLDAHEYANYRLRLTAKMIGSDGNEINTPWNKNMVGQEDPAAHSDYITYTLTRVKLDGGLTSSQDN